MPHSDFPSDPRAIPLGDRRAWASRLAEAQRSWLQRLPALLEPPAPAPDFPAFLLETSPFRPLMAAIGEARTRAQLPTAVADELQRFVDAFRDYLRTDSGEEVFSRDLHSRAG